MCFIALLMRRHIQLSYWSGNAITQATSLFIARHAAQAVLSIDSMVMLWSAMSPSTLLICDVYYVICWLSLLPFVPLQHAAGDDPFCKYNDHMLQLFTSCLFLAGAAAAIVGSYTCRR